MNTEEVVLVNEENEVLGTALKSQVHTANTPLHRAFSIFVFNKNGEVLLQQRSAFKKTWPLVWSNSCCGHPALNESMEAAAKRRLEFELGISLPTSEIHNVLPTYKYRAEKDGIVEHEICPVLIATYNGEISPNPHEIAAIRWVKWQDFLDELKKQNDYSPWCIEESQLLNENGRFQELIKPLI
jgi:isopentenyl-diphosphate delta-isomerase